MRNWLKTVASLVLVLCMVMGMTVSFAETAEVTTDTYTYRTATTALGNNWNPHTWETNADDTIQGFLSAGLVSLSILDSENGIYQWVYDMATSVTDVTKDHLDDLTKYNVTLMDGTTLETTEKGYVFEIKLREGACWQDGTPINADTYITSMKYLLDPEMKNYRANLFYSGESAVAGGDAYYYAGSTAYIDNNPTAGAAVYTMDTLVKDEEGNYNTAEGAAVYVSLKDALAWLGGNTLTDYVEAYGEAYFGMDGYNALVAAADENGRVRLNDDALANIIATITAVADWGEDETAAPNYFVYAKEYPMVDYDSTVGCYKVDDYTFRYVTATYIDINYFLTSLTSNWIVYEPLYTAGFDTTGSLKTTNYCTSLETSMAYGPYKMESFEADKQIVFVQNENWYGWTKNEDGTLTSTTEFLVDGEQQTAYQTTRIVIDVMDEAAMKQAFLKGELTDWTPLADDMVTYAASDRMYKVDETYTMSFFFNTGLENLKTMDASKGNTNSVVLSNIDFRKAFSLAIDRAEYVTATEGYKPAFALMNNLYFYDVYNDPTSSYRNSEPAMQAVCNLYDVQYGEGTPYATLRDAYLSINGYNLTQAKELMVKAHDQLVADGLYVSGDPIHIRIGWAKGALASADNKQLELMNKYINAAASEAGFGTITFEAIGNINDRYGDVSKGEYAIGYGAWGGAAFYPFRNMQVYCDTDLYEINEAGCWDPATEMLTLNVNGEDVEMSWKDWSNALIGSGVYAAADFETKLKITAQLEELYLKKFYRIPLAGTTLPSLLSYQCDYYTEDYNIMYDFGGMRLMTYNYTDAEWAEYVASEGGELSYE